MSLQMCAWPPSRSPSATTLLMVRLSDMLQDFRIAIRVLARRPAFTFVAALSLALGIGANSAIFSLVDSLWFRPIAARDAGRIVRVFGATDQNSRALVS